MKFVLLAALFLSSVAFAREAIDCRGLTSSKGAAQINGRTYYGVFTFRGPLNRPGQWQRCVGNSSNTPMYRYHSEVIQGRRVRYVNLFYCAGGNSDWMGFEKQIVDEPSSFDCLP